MTDLFQEPEDATPLEPHEREGCFRHGSRTAVTSTRRSRKTSSRAPPGRAAAGVYQLERMLSENFLRTLHKRMFGEVWEWAGTFRTTERNIGVQAYRIGVELALPVKRHPLLDRV